jgi:hypothetical protein
MQVLCSPAQSRLGSPAQSREYVPWQVYDQIQMSLNNKSRLLISLGYCLPDEGPETLTEFCLYFHAGGCISFT